MFYPIMIIFAVESSISFRQKNCCQQYGNNLQRESAHYNHII
ncbi:hypothetical protein OPIT5_00085 (plasmid) [Opitutaceae bacterium TAV5]|nr:hypothetical protein OPIT5_00085 [Opitutaceae bacterium TAV5]